MSITNPTKNRQEDLPKSTFAHTAEIKNPFSQTQIKLTTELNPVQGKTPLDDYLTTPITHASMLQAQQMNIMLQSDTKKSFGLN